MAENSKKIQNLIRNFAVVFSTQFASHQQVTCKQFIMGSLSFANCLSI